MKRIFFDLTIEVENEEEEEGEEENVEEEEEQNKNANDDKHDIVVVELIGTGSTASVYKAFWQGRLVALKKFNRNANESFCREVKYLESLHHPSIIRHYGFDVSNKHIFLEFMEGGSLFDMLYNCRRTVLSDIQRISIAKQIASAMNYLHSIDICHLDLNSRNVLINTHSVVKISDFGLSINIEEAKEGRFQKRVGSLRWMSPEIYNRKGEFFPESDVWGFGMILFELGTLLLPYHNHDESVVKTHIAKSLPPEIPPREPFLKRNIFWTVIMKNCWHYDCLQRPTFKEISRQLSKQSHIVSIKSRTTKEEF